MINQNNNIEITSAFELEDLKVDVKSNTVTRGDTSMTIEPRLIRLLVRLAKQAGEVVPRADLLHEISEQSYVSDESLTQAISKIRQVLGDLSRQPRFIKTVPRKGYVLLVKPRLISDDTIDNTSVHIHNKTTESFSRIYEHYKTLLIILLMIATFTVAMILLLSDDTVFIEKGDVEFVEKVNE